MVANKGIGMGKNLVIIAAISLSTASIVVTCYLSIRRKKLYRAGEFNFFLSSIARLIGSLRVQGRLQPDEAQNLMTMIARLASKMYFGQYPPPTHLYEKLSADNLVGKRDCTICGKSIKLRQDGSCPFCGLYCEEWMIKKSEKKENSAGER